MAKHAQPRSSKSGGSWLLGTMAFLAAAAIAVAVMVVDPTWAPRAAVVAGLIVAMAVLAVIVRLSRNIAALRAQERVSAQQHRKELSGLRNELRRLTDLSQSALSELGQLRQQLNDYVLPIAAEPDPVYPSLHLPLVRGVFADQSPDATVLAYTPPVESVEVPPTVSADSGSEGLPPRHLVDLTSDEFATPSAAGL